jgi:methylated-DNA-[protein]-cysteine S-methyltransferase
MTVRAFALFGTAIGTCAIAWGPNGIVWLQLPQENEAGARRRAVRRYPEAAETRPPPGVDLAIRDIVRLMAGEPADLSRISLDMSGVPDFNLRVYAVARAIAPGETLTYGEVAVRIGEPGAARAVGVALGQNPFPIVVPCHRVLAADGRTGGFSARGGVATKMRMLTIERARTGSAPTLFDAFGGLPLAAR